MSEQSKSFYGWWIVTAAFIFMMMIVGFVLYGLPQFFPNYVTEFGWRRDQIQWGNTMSKIIVGPLFGFVAGWAIEKYGPRRIMISGAFFAAIALVGFSFMNSLTQLYTFYFFNALGYLCAGPLPCQVVISSWFSRMRGRMMGIAYVGIGAGGAIVPWLILGVRDAFGWRGALRTLAAIVFVSLVVLALFVVKRQPADLGMLPDGDPQPREPEPATLDAPFSLARVFRTPAFWLLAAGSVLSISAVGGITQNLPLYLTDISKTSDDARGAVATYPSIVLFSSIAGRLAMGFFADRFRKKYVMIATFLIIAFSIPLLVLATDYPALLYVFAVCFGFGLGADYMLIPLMTAECFGLIGLSRILGIIITSDSVGEALMPWAVARIRESTGSYDTGFMLLSAVALAGALAIMAIRYRNGVPVSRVELNAVEAKG
ncbi:MAG TPA: MFS transporter [Blastocatellia bacterium]|nr:MFS transporter [Blastocatellia bacterium]